MRQMLAALVRMCKIVFMDCAFAPMTAEIFAFILGLFSFFGNFFRSPCRLTSVNKHFFLIFEITGEGTVTGSGAELSTERSVFLSNKCTSIA